ncbi:response regulator [bacterium]|nr:MAG: response regulator [bacterium]
MENKVAKKILIIDDQQELISGLATFLKAQGYVILSANDGLYGISQAHKENVDLIILDLSLPAGGGFYVLDNLKKSVTTNNIPVIILTASQEKALEEKAYQMGALAYMRKPFEPKELIAKVKELLGDQ